MPWAQVHWRSDVLGKQTTMQVILPTAGSAPYPTLYLLHGLSDDSTIWLRRSRIEAYVRELPLIVVMPDGYRGFYTDNDSGPAYARHFGEEIPGFIERTFPARAARGARAIGGLSMGGYGALRVALGYPERFCSVNSHSGAVMRLNLDRSLGAPCAGTRCSRTARRPFSRSCGESSAAIRWARRMTCSPWSGARGAGTGAFPGSCSTAARRTPCLRATASSMRTWRQPA